ncbi:MAG: winged helix-turn-helix domain-containing protein [Bacteroidales bacterium]|nr:winged helix-turn-helix domain-containing protein [Bacteroidales bacterium]
MNYQEFTKEEPNDKIQFTKGEKQFTKEEKQFTKEEKPFFIAKRKIYRYIAEKPQITTIQMAERMGLSKRQVLKYIKRLTEMNLIIREGGRKTGYWRIIDKEYEGFFESPASKLEN